MNKQQYTATVQEEGDDLIIELPEGLMKEMQWSIGMTLSWDVRDDGSVVLSAKGENA